jgi:metal-responsive CopG/Arc/MetJ family transcriptional regulator
MATVIFSIPDEIKAEFDRVFDGHDRSALIADLMQRAIADETRRARREKLFHSLTQRRKERPAASNEQIHATRTSGRP